MTLRDNVLIQSHAITPEDMKVLTGHVRAARTTDSLVSRFADDVADDEVQWEVDHTVRDTQEVHLPDEIRERLRRIDDASIRSYISPYFRIDIRDREPSQILHYGVGGHYIPHVDAETLFNDKIGLSMWEKTLDRDLSIVYFLNDDFAGGELVFPDIGLVIKPTAGTLVCFPSDHHYVHGVTPVTAGHRYTIVTWMRVIGMPSMDEINQQALDAYHRAWPKQIEQPPRLARAEDREASNAGPAAR